MNPAPTRSVKRRRFNCYYALPVLAAILAILCVGCGGGSSPMNATLSAAQAQAVSQQVVQALTAALGNTFGGTPSVANEAHTSLSAAVGEAHPDTSGGCTVTGTGESCNFPLSYTGPCSGGGTISVSGDVSGTLNSSGDGSIGTQITVTPTNCAVSGTTFNGDPDITIDGQIGFTNSNPSYPITFTEGGGISYGPNPAGSCQVNVTYTINSLSSCTVTGTVCGQSVNGSC